MRIVQIVMGTARTEIGAARIAVGIVPFAPGTVQIAIRTTPPDIVTRQFRGNRALELAAAMDIRTFQTLPDAERQALFGWGEDLFSVNALGLRWRSKDRHFVLYEDGAPLASASVLRHEVHHRVIGGLGGVITLPEARGRGLARQVVSRATEFMRDDLGVSFGLLFCLPRLVPFYESQGWTVVEQGVLIDQPGGKVPSPVPVMILPFGDEPWPAERVDLGSLPW